MSSDSAPLSPNMVVRLEGEVEGVAISYVLTDGRHTVGTGPDCDLVIPSVGVSRRHAVLEVDAGSAVVEDLGSKNGTWVNGERVKKAVVGEGDVIHFGRTPLRLRRVERGDVDLVFEVQDQRATSRGAARSADADTVTHEVSTGEDPAEWVVLVDEAVRSLIGVGEGGPGAALEVLRRGAGALGASLIEWDGGSEPVALSHVGEVITAEALSAVSGPFVDMAESGREAKAIEAGRSRREPWVAWAAAAGCDQPPRGLLVSGAMPFREPVPVVLGLILRLLLHRERELAGVNPAPTAVEGADLVFPQDYVVGCSRAMTDLHDKLRSLARGDIPVLIVGETGVGKEHIARILHASSPRRNGPFVAVNCAAIPAELLEAELAGIERGVATGVDARKGKLQLAEGGVLFFDEIGDMPLELQAKLLRALQEMEVHPLGARVPVPIDVRVVAATNTNLQQRMLRNEFRRDLYYRIAGIELGVPPLRARREDIPALVERCLNACAVEIGKPVRGITVNALRALSRAPWPGNVRELEHEVRRLVYLCPPGAAIDSSMISDAVLLPSPRIETSQLELETDLDLERRVVELERQLVSVALARTRGNRSQAAKLLGISRNGLALKMERYGLPEP